MSPLKTNDPLALRLLMTDELYFIDNHTEKTHSKSENESIQTAEFDYLGENNKYILILISDPGKDIINAEHLKILTNILTAKPLELRDVAIVNLNKYPSSGFKDLKEFFSFRKLILFGINPGDIGLQHIDSNQVNIVNEIRILATYSFDEMRDDTAKKRMFWNAMKEL